MMHVFSVHQKNQVEVINKIEQQIKNNSLNFSTVSPIEDYENDKRLALTSVHLIKSQLISKIQTELINPLKQISPEHYYYDGNSLHTTIKTIRVVKNPPNFTKVDIEKARDIFSKTIPKHKKFAIYFYRLLLFPNNLALVGTTDSELDSIILQLKDKLTEANIPDDIIYTNSKYFFSNVTLARFSEQPSADWIKKVDELSISINLGNYVVDSVSLLICNAVLKNQRLIQTWKLG